MAAAGRRRCWTRSPAGAVAHLGLEIHDPPQLGLGSAFHYGMYGQVHKDLRQVLGEPVADPFSRSYCGAGVLGTCRDAVWASLDAAAADLEAELDSGDVDDWQRAWTEDAIVHTPAGITSVPLIHWQNRSTFHQVVQIPVGEAATDRPPPPHDPPADPDETAAAEDDRILPPTGPASGWPSLAGLLLVGAAVMLGRRRRSG